MLLPLLIQLLLLLLILLLLVLLGLLILFLAPPTPRLLFPLPCDLALVADVDAPSLPLQIVNRSTTMGRETRIAVADTDPGSVLGWTCRA